MSISEDVLKGLLEHHDHLYYDLDSPEISDEEYDMLCKQYNEITGIKWNADKVPGEVSEVFAEVIHTYPVKSLDKIDTKEEVEKELKRLSPGIIQKKWDGLTLVIYPDGRVATRGKDGSIGEDVSHTAKLIVENKSKCDLPIRGEAVLKKSDFSMINEIKIKRGEKPYKNRRNAVAGLIRTKEPDLEILPFVHFIAYNLLGTTLSETRQLKILSDSGYETDSTPMYLFNLESISGATNYIMNFDKDSLEFEIDGLVIKSNIPNSLEKFGATSHHYKNAIAYKFPSSGKWTKLLGLRWTVGRTGKIVPNADIEAVELLNSTNRRASIHNASMIARKGLCEDCEVFVVKAHDIIPDIRDVRGGDCSKPFKEPDICPICLSKLVRRDSKENKEVYQLYCENANCDSKTILRVVHMAQKEALDIEGLAEETAQKMYDDGYIDNPTDIFYMNTEDIETLDGFATPSAEKLYNAIQARKKVDFAKFLFAAGVPSIGKKKCEDIANNFESYEEFIKDIDTGCNCIKEISGIGNELISNIFRYKDMWIQLRTVIEPIKTETTKKVENQLTIVVTGSFKDNDGNKIPRETIEDKIKKAGHKATSSVSKKTNYVLAGDKPGSKRDKAETLGIPILTNIEDLERLL